MAESKTPAAKLKNEAEIDTTLVRSLADILNDTDLTEIEVERGELRIRVAREVTMAAPVHYAAAPAPAAHAAPAAAPAPVSMPSDPATIVARAGEEVKSPMVGTVYLQASPEAPPFVQAGDKVKKGQTLLIVEAMKTMNPIQAPRDGVVVEVLVGDAQPVEFGEPLVLLEA
ncbi:MAG: acetyl-CoA carboxylase biotin carboxyl carrier protein [Alphaproteobacteria bacterium]|jgi:acetyl-CoA carboxylase biotin carboxyl carrier protein|uniref:acetyl-CoA carboxylase biotin carboxyl carrier protein n=1 Tax=Brevundimonas sp. TaxID=1871086 RepID=UPI0012021007|nr:acetyl-CoA carboxylase biotin carboxyl carrier protein [Brevundimonas sp.]MBU3974488.1 acetyl-CoA carboxylase biotin carboxyl carrier protein [Alphaproteobacteria bacterium]MBA3049071.1 acetyl-CoA carboxylase biotin carboxyl carrier protein [Brevundimonas sp.]MBU4039393.1 acetyl-CoA carboxylase biotin carboxyl carrier protein [Alphaproteobacteria bacterium]MBU4138263.1 acetyl-CoA carboxylase biotin carboxyl carrier protein [Alphaproteobacteria bacterium]TAJ67762.1 MAG: acetyl-CoA carboxylas